jgi:MFS family permease
MSVLSERDRLTSLAAVILAAFGVGLSFGVGLPLTSLTLEAWHQPSWIIGLAGAAPSLAILIFLPLLPRLAARLGAVPGMLLGCLIGALGFVALYLFQSPEAWIAIRFVMSAGLALPWLVGETWMNTVTNEASRGRIVAIYAISFFTGFLTGPVLLGVTGISGVVPFAVGACGTALAGVPVILAARLAPDLVQHKTMSVISAFRLAPIGMAGGLLGGFAEMSYFSLLPNVALAVGLDQGQALGLLSLLTAGGIVLQFAIGWLADKVSRVSITAGLTIAMLLLSAMLPWALSGPIAGPVVAFLLGGIILGFYTIGLVVIGTEVTASDLTAANAAFLIMYQVGAIAGPVLSGAAMMIAPVGGFVATVSVAMILGTLGILWLARLAPERDGHG